MITNLCTTSLSKLDLHVISSTTKITRGHVPISIWIFTHWHLHQAKRKLQYRCTSCFWLSEDPCGRRTAPLNRVIAAREGTYDKALSTYPKPAEILTLTETTPPFLTFYISKLLQPSDNQSMIFNLPLYNIIWIISPLPLYRYRTK